MRMETCTEPFNYTAFWNQEVSAFGKGGEGNSGWLDSDGPYWVRDHEVSFKHSSTDRRTVQSTHKWTKRDKVHAVAQPSQESWKAVEGIFMEPRVSLKAEVCHAELSSSSEPMSSQGVCRHLQLLHPGIPAPGPLSSAAFGPVACHT